MMEKRYRVGVDIGGTFTDLIVLDMQTGEFQVGKVLTTPEDPSVAVEKVLVETLQRSEIQPADLLHVIHGTTLVTNAIIERKGAATALLTTEGFRDSIEIGRENRYDLYDLMLERPTPLVPRYLRFDVPQRTLADGTSDIRLDEAYVERLARELATRGIEAVAVVFLHSFTAPGDEQAARAIIQRTAPGLRVSLSSDVVPEIREFERASTTVANVYVQGLAERYLRELERRLGKLGFEGSFFLMLSSGGIATVDTAVRHPIRLLESGPAAGALAAAAYGAAINRPELLSFDMGGTTAKICVISDGQPQIAHQMEVDRKYRFKKGSGLPVKIPVIEMIEIGTGGGSIARIDALNLLKVGPDSSGADPGPVCYGLGGTKPTVTDANLILGYLNPDFFLGGRMALDVEAARRAVDEHLAAPLGITVEEAAWGVHQIANENMANAARVHALERGKDPRRYPLFAFGGAGPMHAVRIAQSLGSPAVIAPVGAGVLSSVGFLAAPLAFDFVRSWPAPLHALDWDQANRLLAEMEAEGTALLEASGVAARQITHRRLADMRYVGQGHEITVPLPDGILGEPSMKSLMQAFESVYQGLYERLGPPVPVEILNWRVSSSGPRPALQLKFPVHSHPGIDPGNAVGRARKGERKAYFPESGGYVATQVLDRYQLPAGAGFAGPAIVEERESTVIIGPGAHCTVDTMRNLLVDLAFQETRT